MTRQQHGNDCDWFVALVMVDGRTASGKTRNYTEVLITTRIDLLARATTEVGPTSSRLWFDPVIAQSLTDAIRRDAFGLELLRAVSGERERGVTEKEEEEEERAGVPTSYADSESDSDEHLRCALSGSKPHPVAAEQPLIRVADDGRMTDRRLASIVDEYVLTSPSEVAFSASIPTLAPTNWITRCSTAVPGDMSLEVARAVRAGRVAGVEVSRRMEQYRRATVETNKAAALGTQPAWMTKIDDERRRQDLARKRARSSASDGPVEEEETTGVTSGDGDDAADGSDDSHTSLTETPATKTRRIARRTPFSGGGESRSTHAFTTATRGSTDGAPLQRYSAREPCVHFVRALVCFAGKTSHSEAVRIGLLVGAKRGLRQRCDELGRIACENSLPFGVDPLTLLGPIDKLKHTRVCVDARDGVMLRVPADRAEQLRAALLSANVNSSPVK